MIVTHSPFGCPGDYFYTNKKESIKVLIDPHRSYFSNGLNKDVSNFDKLILIQGLEPKELNYISDLVIENKQKFKLILSSFKEVLNMCDNSELFLYASSWILTDSNKNSVSLKKDYHNIFTTNKKFKLSHVMSNKNFLPGHSLRHKTNKIVKKLRQFELMFPEFIPMNEKYKLFEDTMFHITIENTKNHNYISEKIVDCFMSYTIPIYWGCPNIGEYFNENGIISFETEDELTEILDNLKPQDYYEKLSAVKENYQIAYEKYAFWYDRVNEKINML